MLGRNLDHRHRLGPAEPDPEPARPQVDLGRGPDLLGELDRPELQHRGERRVEHGGAGGGLGQLEVPPDAVQPVRPGVGGGGERVGRRGACLDRAGEDV